MGERTDNFLRWVNNIGAVIFPKTGPDYEPGGGNRSQGPYDSSPEFASRRGGDPFDNTRPSFDPGVVVLSGAQHAWNATAFLIMTGQMKIEDVPEHLRSVVQERVDNPAPSVLRAVAEDPDGSIAAKKAQEQGTGDGIDRLNAGRTVIDIDIPNEIERLREEARKQALIDSDAPPPPLRVQGTNSIDPDVNPLTGEPYDGGINIPGLDPEATNDPNQPLTQEQLDEFIKNGTRPSGEEDVSKEVSPAQTPEEKQAEEIINSGGGTPEEKKSLLNRALAWLRSGSPFGGIALLGLPAWLINTIGGSGGTAPGGTAPGGTAPGGTGETKTENPKPDANGKCPDGWEGRDTNNDGVNDVCIKSGTGILDLLRLFGGMAGGGSRGSTNLDDASSRASMQVYDDPTNFMRFAPSPLQMIDPRYYNTTSFVPGGEQKDFNTGFRGVPGQMYANYEGTGPRGVAGLRGNITPMSQAAQVAQGGLMSLAYGGSTSYPRMNGQIAGPGTEKSDDIPAMLSDGEFVVNSAAVRGIGNLMGNKKPKSKAAQRREGARMMYALQKAGEKAARIG